MKRSILKLIGQLLKLIGPFLGVIFLAVVNGTIGFLLAMSITVFAALAVLKFMGVAVTMSYSMLFIIIIVSGLLRGLVRYLEQYSNHFIAFRLLAILRDKLFGALRRLAPSKLDNKEKGQIISLLQSDIETLEVFYAHTITPICIAFFTCSSVIVFLGITTSWILSGVAVISYLLIGVVVPVLFYQSNHRFGKKYRADLGSFQGYYLDSIYGSYEIIAQGRRKDRLEAVRQKSLMLVQQNNKLEQKNTRFKNITTMIIVFCNAGIILVGGWMIQQGVLEGPKVILAYVTLTSSFGSVVALAHLPHHLAMTFASGNRVLDLLEEEALVKEGNTVSSFSFEHVMLKNVDFSYQDKQVLKDVNFEVHLNQVVGILGPSGCGKTTILKLLMHFYDANQGSILYNGVDIKDISHEAIYQNVNLFSQATYLFADTIYNNLLIAKPNASEAEVIEACKNASIYSYILGLKDGFNTKITDLKDNLSSGEKQRLGLARVFLRKPRLLLLDEATSNIDAMNEGIILNALSRYAQDMAIVIISHRKSTLAICSKIYQFKEGCLCLL